jgi:hypothetical protein
LSEKSFVRHIQKWPGRVHSRVRKNSCPGIKSFDNIYLQRVHREPDDDLADVVQKLVDHVVRMTRPGSNAAHTVAHRTEYRPCSTNTRLGSVQPHPAKNQKFL